MKKRLVKLCDKEAAKANTSRLEEVKRLASESDSDNNMLESFDPSSVEDMDSSFLSQDDIRTKIKKKSNSKRVNKKSSGLTKDAEAALRTLTDNFSKPM